MSDTKPADLPSDADIVTGVMAEMDGLNKKKICCCPPSVRVSLAKNLAAACEKVRSQYADA